MLRNVLKAAIADGLTLKVYDPFEGDIDYEGENLQNAMDAIEAVDEIQVDLLEDGEVVGWMTIINDLDEDERIADYAGCVHTILENIA